MRFAIITSALIVGLAATDASANGDGLPTSACTPVRTNTFMPLFDPVPVPGLNTEFSKFESWPLTTEQAKLGFVAKRSSDGAFLVIPNRVEAKFLSWTKLVRTKDKQRGVCASRIVATFQGESDAADLRPLIEAIKAVEPKAKFVRPIMQDVQVEFTIPFLGLMHRFDPKPTFPLGGLVVVWDIDRNNTRILEDFIKKSGPSVDLPGVILMKEMYTGLFFSIAITMSGEKLIENQIEVPAD
jgi:hypothetical protein